MHLTDFSFYIFLYTCKYVQQAKNFALHAAIDLLLYSSRTGCLGYEKKLILQQFREGREGEGDREAEGQGEGEGEGKGEREGEGSGRGGKGNERVRVMQHCFTILYQYKVSSVEIIHAFEIIIINIL